MNINIDFTKTTGKKIKPMHAINGGAVGDYDVSENSADIIRELNIPYARNHDFAYPFGQGMFVDIHCIFKNFDADENDPNSYDFYYTDIAIKETIEAGAQIYYRLGESIDHGPRKNYIHPPADFAKWARICEHIIRHYNEGWADGFEFGIEYWEIWNEPEGVPASGNYPMWTGTKEQFFELYKIAANHLKSCFGDTIKVGGYAAISIVGLAKETMDEREYWPGNVRSGTLYYAEYIRDFLEYISSEENNAPLDFFAFHKYNNSITSLDDFRYAICALRDTVDQYGFKDAELVCDEWNYLSPDKSNLTKSITSAVGVTAQMCEAQYLPIDMMMYYMLRGSSSYNGITSDLNGKIKKEKTFYGMKAFGKLYKMENEIECSDSTDFIKMAAARGKKECGMLIANMGVAQNCVLNYKFGDEPLKSMSVYVTDKERDEKLVLKLSFKRSNSKALFVIPENSIVYIKFELFNEE